MLVPITWVEKFVGGQLAPHENDRYMYSSTQNNPLYGSTQMNVGENSRETGNLLQTTFHSHEFITDEISQLQIISSTNNLVHTCTCASGAHEPTKGRQRASNHVLDKVLSTTVTI